MLLWKNWSAFCNLCKLYHACLTTLFQDRASITPSHPLPVRFLKLWSQHSIPSQRHLVTPPSVMGEVTDLNLKVRCQQSSKMLWGTGWQVHKRIKHRIAVWPSNCTSKYMPQRTESRVSKRYLYIRVHISMIHNS